MNLLHRIIIQSAFSFCLLVGFIAASTSAVAQMTFTSNPTANANNVPVNSNIELDFDADIDFLTVHINSTNGNEVYDDNIKILGNQSGQIEGVYSVGGDNSIVVFNPSIDFKAGEMITVVVSNLVLGTGGEVAIARSFSFIAASGPFEGAFKERPSSGILGMADGSFDWGDYDNDGDLDLIVVGFDPTYTASAIIYNNAGGTFTDIGAVMTGVFFSSCKWGDYDNDGDLDVVVAGVDDTGTTRSTTIYQNNAGVFTDIGAGLQGVDYSALDWGDYDNDGDLDLIVMGRYFNSPFFGSDLASSTIYRNDGGGVFTDIAAGLLPLNNGSVNWGDYDGDGDLDLVMTGFDGAWSTRYSIIYDNNGGVFSDHGAGLPQVAWGDTDWGDYDNDGDLDLLLSGDGAGPTITSIFNNTGGVFTDINAGLPTTSEGSVRWGDFNGDGNLDLIITGNDYSTNTEITHIFRNDGGNIFTDINAGLQTVYFTGLADWGDYDGDGDLDILVAGESTIDPSSTSAILYENTIFNAFVSTWKTDNPGTSNADQITIPTTGTGYLYNVNWGDGMTDSDVTGDITHTYATPGTYTVSITGVFPRIYFDAASFNSDKDSQKLLSVEQWGDIAWSSMAYAFAGCENMVVNAIDQPNLSGVTDMSGMFYEAYLFNSDISGWDVSTITNMYRTFREAEAFNQPLDAWDVSNVTNMSEMFYFTDMFNQDLNSWVVDNVTTMQSMFSAADAFNGNISAWHVNNVSTMQSMFNSATVFNQYIGDWEINATNISGMFNRASAFNQDISTKPGGGNNGGDAWQTNGVLNMSSLFSEANAFAGDITGWDVSTVTNMRGMFSGNTTFNQNISGWIVNNVTDMEDMFSHASSFNQNISGWNVGSVTDMRTMFLEASSFDQNLGGWDVSSLTQAISMFNNSRLSIANYDNLLIGWAAQSVNGGVTFGAEGIYYCTAGLDRAALIAQSWTITDGGSKCITLFNGPDTTAPEILNGQAQAIDFGSAQNTIPKSRSITILNNQGIPITNVQVDNPDPGFPTSLVFVSIPAGGTQTFTVDLTGGVGVYTETITISSPDFIGSFLFDVKGEVTAGPEPEIKVFEGPNGIMGNEIFDGVSLYDIGTEERGTDILSEITITNLGSADLNISNISFSGTAFSVISPTSLLIPVDGSEVVQIQLSGAQGGLFSELLTIESNDADEANFDFGVQGTIIGPDIWVVDGLDIFSDPEILNGQVAPIDFGSSPSGPNVVRQMIITDATSVPLAISNISVTGTAFSILSPATPLGVAGEVDGIYDEVPFNISLSGATAGTFNETVTILSDDDADPIFTFPITGTIVAPFITTWITTDNQIVIPTNSLSYAYNYNVTWKNLTNSGVGDGTATSQTGDLVIAGLTNGDTYQVGITGLFPAIYFDINATNAVKIRTVDQWGDINWASFNSAFRGCTNLVITASDSPNLSGVTDLSRTFMLCSNFNSNINTWDVSNVTDFSLMFYEAFAFNQPLALWNVRNAIDMSSMFESANAFNQDISSWNVANASNLRNMFAGADAFNQNIGSWDVGSVTNFNSMFLTAIAFNQDISGWNVSSGNSFRFMFEDASSFNQNLGNWNISNATNLGSMLSGTGLSVSNYDQTLIGWEALATTPTFQNLGASGLFYCAGAAAHSSLISTYGWTIDDAGQLCVGGEIAVFEGATTTGAEIFDGQVTALDFGSATQGNNLTQQFTIENQGSSALNITSITISGTAYSLLTAPPASIGVGISQTLDIQLSGAATGTFNETVTITSDDADEGTFTFPITGVITAATCASPPTADAGSNQSICEGTAVSLSGTITNAISPAWSTAGDGIFDNTNILTPVYSPGAGDISTGSVTLTLATEDPDGAGPCAAATAQIVITIDGAATVNAGTDVTLCPTDMAALTGTMNANASNPMWSTSGTGTFSTPNNLNSTYTSSAADITAGSVTLTLTVDGSGVCPQVTDQLIITIVAPIVAGTPTIQPVVSQAFNVDVLAASTINTGDIIVITILQNPAKGSVAVMGNNTIDYTASTGTIGADSFEYQICNQCGSCSSGIVSVDIANAPPVITPPSSTLASVAGQSVTIPFSTYFSDPNDNIDFNSFSIISGPTSTAPVTFDSNYDLTIDYSNTPFAGIDQLTIEVCDLLGACAQIDLSIEVDGEIVAHNGISPNGDNMNDYFKITNIQFIEPLNKVAIYNRWGDKVYDVENYDSTNPDKRFNGISNQGKELPSGVYFYKVDFSSGRQSMEGYLTIKR